MNFKTLKSKIASVAKCKVQHRINPNGEVIFFMPHEESRWDSLYKTFSKAYRSSGPLKDAGSNIMYPMRGGNPVDGIVIRTGLRVSKKGLCPLDKDFVNIHNNASHAIHKDIVAIMKDGVTESSATALVLKVISCFHSLSMKARRSLNSHLLDLVDAHLRLGTSSNKRKEHNLFVTHACVFNQHLDTLSQRMEQDVFKIDLGIH